MVSDLTFVNFISHSFIYIPNRQQYAFIICTIKINFALWDFKLLKATFTKGKDAETNITNINNTFVFFSKQCITSYLVPYVGQQERN